MLRVPFAVFAGVVLAFSAITVSANPSGSPFAPRVTPSLLLLPTPPTPDDGPGGGIPSPICSLDVPCE